MNTPNLTISRILEMTRLSYRSITKNFRMFPNFIIAGAPRCGTTSLYAYLISHPCVLPAAKKETAFFNFAYNENVDWYRTFFPMISYKNKQQKKYQKIMITGEATPGYLVNPLVPKRIAKSFPKMKIIVLLRNPIDRAYSHYHHNLSLGLETLSFEEALKKENERIDGWLERLAEEEEKLSHQNFMSFILNLIRIKPDRLFIFSYLLGGIYVKQLEYWMKSFPKEQFLILKSEELFSDPKGIFKQTQDFLEIPEFDIKKYGSHFSGEYSQMNESIRNYLREYFKPHNEKLYKFLGKDFEWN